MQDVPLSSRVAAPGRPFQIVIVNLLVRNGAVVGFDLGHHLERLEQDLASCLRVPDDDAAAVLGVREALDEPRLLD